MKRREIGQGGLRWIDITNPSSEELQKISQELDLEETIIQDCLDPAHLPKHEMMDDLEFCILRTYDDQANEEADTTQELTRKIVIFRKPNFLLTIHRSDLGLIDFIAGKWANSKLDQGSLADIFVQIFQSVLRSYERPKDIALNRLEALEMSIFGIQGVKSFKLHEGYLLKRRSFVFKRLLRSMIDMSYKLNLKCENEATIKQGIKEDAERLYFYCDELTESTAVLISLHISMASQKTNESAQQTNEVVRILTIFSMFLLPLNVITGIYGMNFDVMPELKWTGGYPFALGLMGFTILAIFLWFKSKGWLKLK